MPPVLHVAQSPATAGQPMTLDASGSSDPNGQGIVSYFWTFPDGTIAHGARVTKTYPSAGPTSATLTIVDAAGLLTTGSIAITVDP
jgi:PKD repeat protein